MEDTINHMHIIRLMVTCVCMKKERKIKQKDTSKSKTNTKQNKTQIFEKEQNKTYALEELVYYKHLTKCIICVIFHLLYVIRVYWLFNVDFRCIYSLATTPTFWSITKRRLCSTWTRQQCAHVELFTSVVWQHSSTKNREVCFVRRLQVQPIPTKHCSGELPTEDWVSYLFSNSILTSCWPRRVISGCYKLCCKQMHISKLISCVNPWTDARPEAELVSEWPSSDSDNGHRTQMME